MRFRPILITIFFTLQLSGEILFGDEVISLTNSEGRKIEAIILNLTDSKVTFKRPGNPQEFTIPLTLLSEQSQQQLRKSQETPTGTPPAEAHQFEGVWTVTEELNQDVDPSFRIPGLFRFLIFKGNEVSISNGITSLPAWCKITDDKILLKHAAHIHWNHNHPNGNPELFEATFNHNGDKLEIKEISEYTDKLLYSLTLRRLSDTEVENCSLNKLSRDDRRNIEKLVRFGAKVKTDQMGFVTEFDFTDTDANNDELKVLSSIDTLTKVVIEPEKVGGLLDEAISVEAPEHEETFDIPEKDFACIKAIREGIRSWYQLEPVKDTSRIDNFPILAAHPRNDSSRAAPSFLVKHQGRVFAIHRRVPSDMEEPTHLSHPELSSPIPIGKTIINRFNLQVREITGTPPDKWVFTPAPPNSALLGDGIPALLCRPEKFIPVSFNFGMTNPISYLPGGCPSNTWSLQAAALLENHADIPLSGFPVVDSVTGHLVGISNGYYDRDEHEIHIEPVADLFRFPAPENTYQNLTFFDIKGPQPFGNKAKSIEGIFSPVALEYKFGKTNHWEAMKQRKFCFWAKYREHFGREYLFSMHYTGNYQSRDMWIGGTWHCHETNPSDERIGRFAQFLFREFGTPDLVSKTKPILVFGNGITFIWKRDGLNSYLQMGHHHERDNRVSMVFCLQDRAYGEFSSNTGRLKMESGSNPKQELDDFLSQLKEAPPHVNSNLDNEGRDPEILKLID